MNVFSDIRKNLSSAIIRKQAERNLRQKRVCNLSRASSLAVLFGPVNDEGFQKIKVFLKSLSEEGHKLYVIGYVNHKTLPEFLAKEKSINFITNEDLNWLYKPKNDFYKAFTSTNFDILINLDMQNSIPIQYLCSSSVSGFKVGTYTDNDQLLDFMINTNCNASIDYLIKNIDYYLRIVNQKNKT